MEQEDFSYTYLPQAKHSWELDPLLKDIQDPKTREYLAMALRLAAGLALGYLLLHSNIGYLVGISKKKRAH